MTVTATVMAATVMAATVMAAGMKRLAAIVLGGVVATSCHSGPSLSTLRPQPNFPIVLILVDALRADRVASLRKETATDLEASRVLTPNLDALAKDAVVFRNAFASAPKTIPSVPQIFTSQYFPDTEHAVTLLSVCKDAGYQATAAFIHNPYATKWLGRLDPTFDLLRGGEFNAVTLTDESIEWLRGRPSDQLFLYVHYLDVHMPLKPPPEVAARLVDPAYTGEVGLVFTDIAGAWGGRYDARDKQRIRDIYDATVAATDLQIGRVFAALREAGLYDNALIVVTADHGEELWDHDGFFHGHTLFDELLRVPLLVKFPGSWAAGTKVDDLARTVDILPTVADLLARASSKPAQVSQASGESLVPLVVGDAEPRTLFATVGRIDDRSPPLHALRSDSAKLVTDVRTGREQLFDLVADPHERTDLSADPVHRELLQRMRERMLLPMKHLADTGVHVRVSNGSQVEVAYTLEVGSKQFAPIVNPARLNLEAADLVALQPRATGLTLTGTLAPGDHDELRFEVLTADVVVTGVLKTPQSAIPVQLCVGGETACAPLEGERFQLDEGRMEVGSAPPVSSGSSLQLQGWRVPGGSGPIAPGLTAADKERLRALGYAE